MEIKSIRDLIVWQKAMSFVAEVYRATASFPSDERFGLTAQLRRSAVSVPSNIAEGHGREGTREFLNFLSVAYTLFKPCAARFLIAERLTFLVPEKSVPLLEFAQGWLKMINGLRNSLKEKLG